MLEFKFFRGINNFKNDQNISFYQSNIFRYSTTTYNYFNYTFTISTFV